MKMKIKRIGNHLSEHALRNIVADPEQSKFAREKANKLLLLRGKTIKL